MPPKKVREEVVGKATMRLVRSGDEYVGIVIQEGRPSPPISGGDPDEVWKRLRNEVGKASPEYFGYEGAKARFLSIMPFGFQDKRYVDNERMYKVATQRFAADRLPLARASAAMHDDAVEASRVYSKTNLLSQFEHARMQEILKGDEGPAFVTAAAAFAEGDRAAALFEMNSILSKHGSPSWPAVTYLPFFWLPQSNMFLKPAVTRDFAERVGHPFAREYSSQLHVDVYASLLDLAEETEMAIADLRPVDRIDVQSFIWVIGGYSEKDIQEIRQSGGSTA
jgi:hypothetical protein